MYNLATETLIFTKFRALHVSSCQTVLYASGMWLMHEPSLGNNLTQVIKQLCESHSGEWHRGYLSVTFQVPPVMSSWKKLLTSIEAGWDSEGNRSHLRAHLCWQLIWPGAHKFVDSPERSRPVYDDRWSGEKVPSSCTNQLASIMYLDCGCCTEVG
ncbi:Tudor domain-containing protein 15 [Labeo rohita]|uniref:Tudor domain-containing protein 15 n=1 Tax=Labeo rohita TaxID=84645 RepID=A0ABQ8MR82_LABRO|nr:Tudor domain-containing protein 15 [Labeo rohita]